MTCLIARKHFSDAVDGQPVSGLMKVYVGFHRAYCPLCQRYEKSLRHTMAVGRALKDLPLDDEGSGNDAGPTAT
jgi:hypothetical protein